MLYLNLDLFHNNDVFTVIFCPVVLPLLVVIVIVLKFFPLLACIEASPPFLAHCLGLLFSVVWYNCAELIIVVEEGEM